MSEERNKSVVTRFLRAVAAGDIDTVAECFGPETLCWTPATPPFWGRPQTGEDYIHMCEAFYAQSEGHMEGSRLVIGPLVADGEYVAVQMESTVAMADGRTYNNQYHLFFAFKEGRIAVLKEYLDSLHLADIMHGVLLGGEELPDDQRHNHRLSNLWDLPESEITVIK